MNFNKVILLGRLTQDPQLRNTGSGTPVCTLGLATNRIWTDRNTNEKKQESQFHNIVLWRRLAEIASQYLNKGALVLIEGRLQTRTWENSQGNRQYRTEVVAENMQLAPKTTPSAQASFNQPEADQKTSQEEIPIIEEGEEQEEINVEDIPF